MSDLENLLNLFRATNDFQNPKARQDAENTLREVELKPRFGPMLLELIAKLPSGDAMQLSVAIYFKNCIKRNWKILEDGQKLIHDEDRHAIKTSVINMMLNTPPNVKKQLSAAITIIANHDFPNSWQELLPELVRRLEGADPTLTFGVLEIIQSITKKYQNITVDGNTYEHIRYIMNVFAPKWLALLDQLTKTIRGQIGTVSEGGGDAECLKYQVKSATLLVQIFFDLNTVDIIDWFENTMDHWMPIFEQLLQTEDSRNVLRALPESAGPLEMLRTEVMKVLVLYNQRYEEQYRKFVPTFIGTTCQLVARLNADGRYDMLVAQAIAYLTSVVKQRWHQQLFDQEKIGLLIQHIVIPNVMLRESDKILYETEGDLYVTRDLEGSDLETRRRGVSEFISGLLEYFEEIVTQMIMGHVERLLKEYEKNKSNFETKDAAITLVLAVSVKGKTRNCGATILNDKVPLGPFFQKVIMPHLEKKEECHPLIYADCIKFLNMFRSIWDQSTFEQLLELLVSFLNEEDYVLHTYAAFAIDKVLSLKVETGGQRTFRFPKQRLVACLAQTIQPLFQIVATRPESFNNEHVMRTILRVITRADDAVITVIGDVLASLRAILERICKHPGKPGFNHCVFEVIAASISIICRRDSSKANDFEERICPTLFNILENQNITEFHPYVYQILALLLRVRPDVSARYSDLFDKLLLPSLWSQEGTIQAISGMFGDYLSRVKVNEFVNRRRLEGMLGIFQKLLSQRTHEPFAFEVLNPIFEFISLETLVQSGYLARIFQLCFQRLQNSKTSELCSNFVVSLAVFTVKHGAPALLTAMNQVQQGIFGMVLGSVWIQYARKISKLSHRRIATFAMVRMMECDDFWNLPELRGHIPKLFEKTIELFEANPEEADGRDYLEELEAQGFDAKFSRLKYAFAVDRDLTKPMGDPRESFVRVLVPRLESNGTLRQQLSSSLEGLYVKQFNTYCERAQISFKL